MKFPNVIGCQLKKIQFRVFEGALGDLTFPRLPTHSMTQLLDLLI